PGHGLEGGVGEDFHVVPAFPQDAAQAHEREHVAVRAVGGHDHGAHEEASMARAAWPTVSPSTKSTSTGSSTPNSLSTMARNWTIASDWPPSSKKSWSGEVTSTPRISDQSRMTSFSSTLSTAMTPVSRSGRAVWRPGWGEPCRTALVACGGVVHGAVPAPA